MRKTILGAISIAALAVVGVAAPANAISATTADRFGPVPDSTVGTTVIAAHVDSLEYGLGPFAELNGLGACATALGRLDRARAADLTSANFRHDPDIAFDRARSRSVGVTTVTS